MCLWCDVKLRFFSPASSSWRITVSIIIIIIIIFVILAIYIVTRKVRSSKSLQCCTHIQKNINDMSNSNNIPVHFLHKKIWWWCVMWFLVLFCEHIWWCTYFNDIAPHRPDLWSYLIGLCCCWCCLRVVELCITLHCQLCTSACVWVYVY